MMLRQFMRYKMSDGTGGEKKHPVFKSVGSTFNAPVTSAVGQ